MKLQPLKLSEFKKLIYYTLLSKKDLMEVHKVCVEVQKKKNTKWVNIKW